MKSIMVRYPFSIAALFLLVLAGRENVSATTSKTKTKKKVSNSTKTTKATSSPKVSNSTNTTVDLESSIKEHEAAVQKYLNSSLHSMGVEPEEDETVHDMLVPMMALSKGYSRRIPHNMWFTYSANLLDLKTPQEHYHNVLKTIRKYGDLWDDKKTTVNFLDDELCAKEIALAEPQLLPYFEKEEYGPYRGDICRTAVLYLYGGYYFDVDMVVVEPYEPKEVVTFSTTLSCGGGCFSQSFIAAEPRHPILKLALKQMLEVYEDGLDTTLIGPITLARAYYNLSPKERGMVHLLQEKDLDDDDYPDVERQTGRGHCNHIHHDPAVKKVYFFARFVGSGPGCKVPKTHETSRSRDSWTAPSKKDDKGAHEEPMIPRKMWFTSEHNILFRKKPASVFQNVMGTIAAYRDYWHEKMAPIEFLDNLRCERELTKAEPRLVPYFKKETVGAYKGDMCKTAVLYNNGGYYFDVDLRVIHPFRPEKNETFASVLSCRGSCFYSSFVASKARHPILKHALEDMLYTYEHKMDNTLLGPFALVNGYYSLEFEERESIRLLQELDLAPEDYPKVTRQIGVGHCNYVIHDPKKERAYFFQRYVGYPGCDAATSTNETDSEETQQRLLLESERRFL